MPNKGGISKNIGHGRERWFRKENSTWLGSIYKELKGCAGEEIVYREFEPFLYLTIISNHNSLIVLRWLMDNWVYHVKFPFQQKSVHFSTQRLVQLHISNIRWYNLGYFNRQGFERNIFIFLITFHGICKNFRKTFKRSGQRDLPEFLKSEVLIVASLA